MAQEDFVRPMSCRDPDEPKFPEGYNEHIVDQIKWEKIHEPIRSGLKRWVTEGTLYGGFLRAVLTNNLRESLFLADSVNQKKLVEIVQFIYWELPNTCWGSEENVVNWARGFR